jgi:hypothetical protein
VVCFKVLSGHFLEELRKVMNNLNKDSRSPGLNLNPGPPEYEGGMVTTQPHRKENEKIASCKILNVSVVIRNMSYNIMLIGICGSAAVRRPPV